GAAGEGAPAGPAAGPAAGAAAGAGPPAGAGPAAGAGAVDTCATPLAAARDRLAQRNNALIIALHPAVALREDFPLAAAPSSRTPTKLHHPHRPRPRTRSGRQRVHSARPATPATPAGLGGRGGGVRD